MSRRARSPRRSNRRLAFAVALLASLVPASPVAAAGTLLPPDPSIAIGNVVPLDGFVDENGNEFSTLLPKAELDRDPRPWIVSPMYTRCPTTCPAVTANLRRAIDESDLKPSEYRVVSFSFDPDETADGLREFRSHIKLPPQWLTLRAPDRPALERTLKSLDFRTMTVAQNYFQHPNLIAVLAPDMRLTGYLFGINFAPGELARTVRRARNGASATDSWRPYLFLFAVLGFLASAGLFAFLLSRRRRRLTHVATSEA